MELRDYQQDLFSRIQGAIRRGVRSSLVVSPTGSGKTATFCYIASRAERAGSPTLILAHRRELITQTSGTLGKFQVRHGIIQPGITPDPGKIVQLGMVQTIARRLGRIAIPKLIIVDECFPKGTLIGNTEIQDIRAGDLVDSFNHSTGKLEKRNVLGVMQREYKGSWFRLRAKNGSEFVCTENHPIWTKEFGYIPIKSLHKHVVNGNFSHVHLQAMRRRKDTGQIQQKAHLSILFEKLQSRKSKANCVFSANTSSKMFSLWSGLLSLFTKKSDGMQKKRGGLLFRELPKDCAIREIIKDNDSNEFAIQCYYIPSYDVTKSNAKKRDIGKNEEFTARKNFSFAWRKWSTNKTTAKTTRSNSLSNGILNSYKRIIFSKFAYLLQSGLSYCRFKNSNRSRRKNTSPQKVEVFRQKKDGDTERIRLESIEVYKRGSGSRPSWVPQENRVYNIHVSENNNYFANGILVHNCHHTPGSQYRAIIKAFPNAAVVGFTATPLRLDGKGLGDYFHEIIPGPAVEWLMENGHLCRPRYFAPPMRANMKGIKKRGGDYAIDQLADAMTSARITGDAVKHYQKLTPNARAVAFCVNIRHAEHVCGMFNSAGISSGIIKGDMTADDRRKIVSDLADGRIRVMVSVDVISEGFDLPSVETAILMRPTQSLGLYLQQIGRILRPSPSKTATILDHAGNIARHGLAEDDREWSLEGQDKKSKKTEAGTHKQCGSCYAMFLRLLPSCPECGWTPPPPEPKEFEHSDEELVEIRRAPIQMLLKDVKTRKDLKIIQKAKGYKPGWTYYMAKELQLK
jgi:superfamily II DNA or RNA helicase